MDFVPDMAAKRAEITPDRAAFHDVETGRIITFAEVDDRANRFAHGLASFGIAAGDRIAILCLNRTEFFEILFACAKAEVILVPLNWRQPPAELEPIVTSSGAKLIVHDGVHAATAAALAAKAGVPRVALDDDSADHRYAEILAGAPAGPAGPGRRAAGDVWYLLYTSGTTGAPKAVIQTFAMAWANAVNIGQAIDLTSAEESINYLPLFHTAGINLYTLPIFLAGGLSHVLRKFDPDTALDLIGRGEVTAFFGVPAIYQAFSLHPRLGGIDLSPVRSWGCGGAPLPEPLIRLFAERGVLVCNGFGMTETGPTVFLMDRDHAEAKIGSVGKAQMLAEVRIVDPDDRPVGDGQAGELQIRGPGVTPGYFGNPDATRAAFAPEGWLRTGDIATRDGDGYYYIVDRIKDMYISGGENVYPAEVERVLNAHGDVLEAAVIGVADDRWGEVGRAFLIARPGRTIDVARLGPWCRERLAAYKVPKSFVVLDELPRTAAGKVQKHMLKRRGDG
jgi:fatty-acyl-CoA synthase